MVLRYFRDWAFYGFLVFFASKKKTKPYDLGFKTFARARAKKPYLAKAATPSQLLLKQRQQKKKLPNHRVYKKSQNQLVSTTS
jgi:hypothetical protein